MSIPPLRFLDTVSLRRIILEYGFREQPSSKTFNRERTVQLTGQNKSRLVFGGSPTGLNR